VKLSLPPQGTPAVPLIVGFTKALEIAVKDREVERNRLSKLSTLFVQGIQSEYPEVVVSQTLPNIVNVSVPNVLPEFLVLALDKNGLMVSAGPACNSNKPEPPETPVRFSFGRQTSEKDISEAIKIFCLTLQNMLK
jgi:cysteine desulfurase